MHTEFWLGNPEEGCLYEDVDNDKDNTKMELSRTGWEDMKWINLIKIRASNRTLCI